MVLYLNNFKGFSDTFIPLEQVNFLVGENSTGKSTILSVLEILSKSSFWTSPQLSSPEYKLGPFREIVNQFSSNPSFFQIGLEFESINSFNPKESPCLLRYLETFVEVNGSILLDSIQYSQAGVTIYCSDLSKGVITISMRSKQFSSFEQWIHSLPPKRKRQFRFDNMGYLWIPTLMQFVQDKLRLGAEKYSLYFPLDLSRFTVMSPIRAVAHRIYETFMHSYSPQGEHVPVVLNRIMQSNRREDKAMVQRLNDFGKKSSLFDSIDTRGFGKSSDSPFSVYVSYDSVQINLTNVGYGVTQSLPLAVEVLKAKNTAFSIQQPEVHLHPKAQAAFGDVIYESSVNSHNSFFCETHSDYIVNRFRYALNKGAVKVRSQVLFFTRDETGTHVKPIVINETGHFLNVPEEYTHFFIDEELRMLEF